MDIKNKVVIITGASEGIGAATAKILAQQGAQVVLAARSDEKIGALAHELNASAAGGDGTRALAIHADMREPEDIKNLIDRTLAVYGQIDILINNAGQGLYGPVETIDLDKYHEVMNLNVYGPLCAMQLVIPVMRKQGGGMILNISSRVSKNYFPNLAAYASTKYALNALSLTARTELAKDKIIVSVMHPKMTATNFGKNALGERRDFTANRPVGTGTTPAGTANPAMQVDTAEAVAEKIAELIQSEAAEAEM